MHQSTFNFQPRARRVNRATLIMKNTPKTALDICNLALKKLGEPFPIDRISWNGNLPSRLCYNHYHPERRETLCARRWDFAQRVVTLTGGSPFRLPDDCLRIQNVSTTGWTLQGRNIYAAQASEIKLTYTADIEDVEQFSADFIEAFTLKLAAKMCIPLLRSTTMAVQLRTEYATLIQN